jgi:hypothetical protein
MEFVLCPESDCQALAEIVNRFVLASTHGPVEHAKTICLNGHVRTPLAIPLATATWCSPQPEAPKGSYGDRWS